MLKSLLIIVIFICLFVLGIPFSLLLTAQTVKHDFNGIILSENSRSEIDGVSVTLLQAQDSVLISSTVSKNGGKFSLFKIIPGSYILLLERGSYEAKTIRVAIPHVGNSIDTIYMKMRSKLIDTVSVTGRMLISAKGDTIEYLADSYKTHEGAKVEELIKQLPGLTVDNKGGIKAYGEDVKKVLVDGEEFFGDDPTLVTKNIRSKMVQKIQLYDRKSKFSEFTGQEDGRKEKTLNVELKEEARNGSFGEVESGIGTSKFDNTQGKFNYFKGKRKIGVHATYSNIGGKDLSNLDNASSHSLDPIDKLDIKKGVPRVLYTGLHFDDKWNKETNYLNTDYQFSKYIIDGKETTEIRNNINSSEALFNNTKTDFLVKNTNHQLKGKYELKPDSSLVVNLDFNFQINNFSSERNNRTSNLLDGTGISRSDGTFNSNKTGDNTNIYLEALLNKKINSRGRMATVRMLTSNFGNKFKEHFLFKSETDSAVGEKSANRSDQNRVNSQYEREHEIGLTYTEPIAKVYLNLAYNAKLVDQRKDFETAFNIPNKEDYFGSIVHTKDFFVRQTHHVFGISANSKIGEAILNTELKYLALDLLQRDYTKDFQFAEKYHYFLPQANYRYNFSKLHYIKAELISDIIVPSLYQLNPLVSNADPFNIVFGNPSLAPSKSYNVNLDYLNANMLTGKIIQIIVKSNRIFNPIIPVLKIQDDVNEMSFTNEKKRDNYDYSLLFALGRQYMQPNIQITGLVKYVGSRYTSIINDVDNNIKSDNWSLGGQFKAINKDKFDINLDANLTINVDKYQTNSVLKDNYPSFNSSFTAKYYILRRLNVVNSINYIYYKESKLIPQSFSRLVWNAVLEYSLTARGDFTTAISCNDILNQNSGFQRMIQDNRLVQKFYSTIPRYFMLSIKWRFDKFNIRNLK